ncbi:AIR synthase [Caloranaerobacter sp. TR13]|uniref:AIR synthase family protein n=1 Tax=Caloranaerobacter sp. TR13 TaxID=1302151 RepID=UPI0006D484DE|nr:AIR synthase family protein [Caloranaerobacter sp. TR13]KPU27001.1 AIR synthase [Caloranaerobacter sp. TR13]
MKIGKLPNDLLKSIVFSNIKYKRDEVVTRAGIGEDCAVLNLGDDLCVVSTDPITGASKNLGKLAVHISCNDVASNGAEPVGLLMTILAPKGTEKDEIELIMKEAGLVAEQLNVEIIGGHTEISSAVNKIVVSTTVIGRQARECFANKDSIKIGDKILLTKYAGLEGTAIIAYELENKLKDKLSLETIEKAKEYMEKISVVKEGLLASKKGALYMHDVTEGGVLGAIWEMANAISKGVKVFKENIPLTSETKSICKLLNIDPLKLISSGSMLIIAPKGKADEIISELINNNINVSLIGEIIEKGILIEDEGSVKEILPPESDELYKVV